MITMLHEPPHLGEVLREEFLKPLGLSVTTAARILGVSYDTLSQIINGKSGVTQDIAQRLALHFRPSAESWLRHQDAWDRWHVGEKRVTGQESV